MTQISWYKKLRKLNPRLRVCQFDNSRHLPGIYYVDEREGIMDVCATDLEYVPALPRFDSNGVMIKSGYRRVVLTLLALKLTTRDKVREVFPGFFDSRFPGPTRVQTNSIHAQWSEMMKNERQRQAILGEARQVDVQDAKMDKMKQMQIENFNRKSNAALSGDQFLEVAAEIDKDMTNSQRRALDEAKFNYDKAVGKRKSIS